MESRWRAGARRRGFVPRSVSGRERSATQSTLPACQAPAGPATSRQGRYAAKRGRGTRQPLPDGPGLAPCLQAGNDIGDTHSPSPRFLPKLHSMPPASRTVPTICWPMRLSSTGCHGTSWKPMPSSIMAKRPLASWVEPTSVPLTYSPDLAAVNVSPRSAAMALPTRVTSVRSRLATKFFDTRIRPSSSRTAWPMFTRLCLRRSIASVTSWPNPVLASVVRLGETSSPGRARSRRRFGSAGQGRCETERLFGYARALATVTDWCRRNRHLSIPDQHAHLTAMMRGHYAYYGITGNFRRLSWYAHQVARIWQKWLSRRDRGSRLHWNQFTALRKRHPLPAARIVHHYTFASETLP